MNTDRAASAVASPAVPKALADQLYEAIRLTREYVGEELLPPVPGWSWFDAMTAYENFIEEGHRG